MSEQLSVAAECFWTERDLMWKVWEQAGGLSNPEAWQAFVKPAVRRSIVLLVLTAQAENDKATAHLNATIRQTL